MLEFYILVILSLHGGNPTGPTCQLWEGYLYIMWGVPEDHLIEVLPLGGLMIVEGLKAFLLMVLMVLVASLLMVPEGLVAFFLMVSEGLVAFLLVVMEAP